MITNNLINSFILGMSFVLTLIFLALLGNIFINHSKIKKKRKIIILFLISILMLIKNSIIFIDFLKLENGKILNSHNLIIDIILIFSGIIALIIERKSINKTVLIFIAVFLSIYITTYFITLPLLEIISGYGMIFSIFVSLLEMIIKKD